MTLARLTALVPDAEARYTAWRVANPESDLQEFAADLHKQGLLSQTQLRDLLTEGEVSFTISEALGRIKGTPSSNHRLLGLLGKGAMGEVHIARDTELHRNVAVKLMDPNLAKDPQLVRRFLTEVQVTAQLDHPSIVPVYALERRPDGTIGYAMRIVRGKTLEQYIRDTQGLYRDKARIDEDHSLSNRLLIFQELCNAIYYAHCRGVVHRDLKPENIMIGSYGEVMVMDWGIARVIGGPEETAIAVESSRDTVSGTQFGMAVGTPSFMSPEQANGKNDELDGRSDQYALGLILFELVSLKRAITGKVVQAVVAMAQDGDKADLVHAFGEPIPRELAAIIGKATRFEPKDRYPDVEAFAADVRRFLRDEPVVAAPDRGLQRVTRWVGRHRQATVSAIVALFLLLVVVGAGSLAAGLTAVGVQRYLAQVREEALTHVIGVATERGHAIDATFQRFGGMESGLAAQAEFALQDASVPPEKYYLAADFSTPATAPPDLGPAKLYEIPASLDFADNALAPGLDPVALTPRLQQLNALQPHMKRMLLRSASEDSVDLSPEDQRELVFETGVPIVWVYVATDDGILTGIPGTGQYPADYDPRKMDWYIRTKGTRGLVWNADLDESGQGLLVTVSSALYDDAGRYLGVAALDTRASWVSDHMLQLPELGPHLDVALIDENGLVVAGTDMPADASKKTPYRRAAVAKAIAAGTRSGEMEVGGDLVVWTGLGVVPWTYVVAGPSSDLLPW